ncbi:MAG: GNAT family N-acetyltransferase [Rhodanobacter sp.]
MRLQNFHVEVAEWSREDQRAALLDLRRIVFIEEQHVPEQRERDGLDTDCWHVLARDESGAPIGCGRLTPTHKIGRMAVLPNWRDQGVGAALLRALIARARAQGWPEVALDAQVTAIRFYQREGFTAHGEEFQDAGLAHRAMRMALPVTNGQLDHPWRDVGLLAANTFNEVIAARLQLLADCRHQVAIHLPVLDNDSYTSVEELDELRRIATSGRTAQIRILLHDPETTLRNDHRLITLAQRLPSAFQIRIPVEDTDRANVFAYLLNDVGGYLFRPEAGRVQGRAARHDRASQIPLRQHFDEVWDRSERASMLQTLNI